MGFEKSKNSILTCTTDDLIIFSNEFKSFFYLISKNQFWNNLRFSTENLQICGYLQS